METIYALAAIALLLVALGFIGLLKACDQFRREAQREREQRLLERARAGWEP